VAVVLVQLEEQETVRLALEVTQVQELVQQLQVQEFSTLAVEAVEAILERLLLALGLLVVETVVATILAQIHLLAQTV
jgi:histone H3/H4